LKDGRPYEIFTGIADEEMFPIPKTISKGYIIKNRDENGISRYDFQYTDKYGYKNTLGGLSHMFEKEYWNYAKLISSVLRHGMQFRNGKACISLRSTAILSIHEKRVERA
jgi:ribonucleoside-diphosphate reductase alpha chain